MSDLLETFFRHYLAERNLEATLELVTDQVISIGTGEHEVARGKEELRNLIERELEELPFPLQYEMHHETEVIVTEYVRNLFVDLYVKLELKEGTEIAEMRCRFTGCSIKTEDGWKFSLLHMSKPAEEQKEETFFPLHYGKEVVEKLSPNSSEKLLDLITKTLPGGIMGGYLKEGFPLYIINDKMLDMLGYSYEELVAVTDEKMMNVIYIEDRARIEQEIYEQFAQNREYEIEYRMVCKGGKLIWVNDIGKKIVTENGHEAMISVIIDISERIERENLLIEDAEHDPLTRLYNRKKVIQLMERAFGQSANGILFVFDVDNFKYVNDIKGHAVGDQVLIQLAAIMRQQAEESAIIARLGGDEYVMFFPGTVDLDYAESRVQIIQSKFVDYMKKLDSDLNVSLSVGGAVREHSETVRELYIKADTALYQAKRKKKGSYYR